VKPRFNLQKRLLSSRFSENFLNLCQLTKCLFSMRLWRQIIHRRQTCNFIFVSDMNDCLCGWDRVKEPTGQTLIFCFWHQNCQCCCQQNRSGKCVTRVSKVKGHELTKTQPFRHISIGSPHKSVLMSTQRAETNIRAHHPLYDQDGLAVQ
jgi:hypothetical protein